MNFQKFVNDIFLNLEKKGLIKKTSGILREYEKEYPFFKELETNYDIIRKECEALLTIKEQLNDMEGVAGKKTQGGIYIAKWKSFMFKSGSFIDENCELCPQTSEILKRVPRIKQAFFSILYPNQHIKPHRGYYQGFMRYHLGVIVPDNNVEKKCWLRVNDDPEDNKKYDKSTMHKGESYHWKNGEGVIFNDNYLHDAANESDEIRVILWLDVYRRLPFWIDWLNILILYIAYRTKRVKAIAEKAKVKVSKK
ncbi:MAG: aspartyl/asparaginyl beta-hydroxylase domain-containing protein [Cyclobacteriaceae bacterium]